MDLLPILLTILMAIYIAKSVARLNAAHNTMKGRYEEAAIARGAYLALAALALVLGAILVSKLVARLY